jgi:integrase
VIGERQIQHLKIDDIQPIYNDLVERGFSSRTVRHTHVILNAALNQAVRWGLLRSNPAIYAHLPAKERGEARAMTQEQAQRFLAACQSDERCEYFSFLLATGVRPSEACAIQWSDISFETKQLTLERTLVRPEGGGWAFEETKTGNRRSFELPQATLTMLEAFQKKAIPNKHGLVFTTVDGEPLDVRNLNTRNFKRICTVAGLEGFSMYHLRHTCATLLLLAGVHPKVVSERLGHADITTTLNVYAHVLPTMQKEASDKLNAMLFTATVDLSEVRTVN